MENPSQFPINPDLSANRHSSEPVRTHEYPSAPVGTGAHLFGEWLTVQEAVAYCLSRDLPRTQKTVRKWASRAAMSPSDHAEIIVQKQDTENGYRWMIERASLDVKIEQERDFETRARESAEDAHLSAPVGTGAHQESVQMVDFLMKQIETKDQQLAVKDRQIESMLERDRETNILIQGLHTGLTSVLQTLPSGREGRERYQNTRVDNSQETDPRDAVQ